MPPGIQGAIFFERQPHHQIEINIYRDRQARHAEQRELVKAILFRISESKTDEEADVAPARTSNLVEFMEIQPKRRNRQEAPRNE